MEYKGDINKLIDRYVVIVDSISEAFNYNSNIKHLLYLIVPAFVLKYGIDKESTILKCFESIKISETGVTNEYILASYNRHLVKDGNNYKTIKYILLNKFTSTNAISEIMDSIIHEYNHAVNSYNNEISYDDKYVKIRTGLSYLIYDKNTLSFIKKSKEVSLEEIINTEQTEEIINIINSFNSYDIENTEFKTTLYTLNKEIDNTYKSNAYEFDSYICKELMNNKTFLPTISNLRFKGFIEDIPDLFDNVIGRPGSYTELNKLLSDIHNLEIKYMNSHLFKDRILNKLRGKAGEVMALINEYDSKCLYK